MFSVYMFKFFFFGIRIYIDTIFECELLLRQCVHLMSRNWETFVKLNLFSFSQGSLEQVV